MSPRQLPRRRSANPTPSPATWISARARNALRRPVFIGTVSTVTFVLSLLALVIVPQQAKKKAAAIRPAASLRPDTEPTVVALNVAQQQVRAADAAIAQARLDLQKLVSATALATAADTLAGGAPVTAGIRTRRDSLNGQIDLLNRLISRSENAPLLGSYRALAQSPPLQSDPRVRQFLDSLVEIERERDSYSAVGGVDPVFVALTARANELGRNIQALADARRTALKTEVSALAPPSPILPTAVAQGSALPDTMARIAERNEAQTAAAGVAARLARERAELQQLDLREERARELSSVGASPSAMLAAALVFGAMLGFGLSLLDEVRHPRVAEGQEAERATGVRVLSTIHPVPLAKDRARRSADQAGPPYIDPGSDGHQLIYLTIATAGSNTVMLTVTGDSSAVSAIVAINFAAIAADEARATLLIDVDGAASSVTSALRLRPSAGVAGLVDGTARWTEVTRTARLGRDRTIDVITSGERVVPIEALAAFLEREGMRLTKQYDAVVIVSSQEQVLAGLPRSLPIPDVLYCARAGRTPVSQLAQTMTEVRDAGVHARGIVLWNAPDPVLAELRAVEEVEREHAEVA